MIYKILFFLCLVCATPALAQNTRFLSVDRVLESTAWNAATCGVPTTGLGQQASYKYIPCQDNGTWSAGDFQIRFWDDLPRDIQTANIHVKVVFESVYGTGAGSNNGMTFLIGANVYDDLCALCTSGGCVAPCQTQYVPTLGYAANRTQLFSNGRCQGGSNDDTACTADSTCTGGGVCITKIQYTTNASNPIQLVKAYDGSACSAASCGGRPVIYTVEVHKTGGGFTLDRDWRIRGLLIEFDCSASGTGGTACPSTL